MHPPVNEAGIELELLFGKKFFFCRGRSMKPEIYKGVGFSSRTAVYGCSVYIVIPVEETDFVNGRILKNSNGVYPP